MAGDQSYGLLNISLNEIIPKTQYIKNHPTHGYDYPFNSRPDMCLPHYRKSKNIRVFRATRNNTPLPKPYTYATRIFDGVW